MEKIGNMQITDNKENKFFCFPIISMAFTGAGYKERKESLVNWTFTRLYRFSTET